ncbi:hypothetical protein CAPTEDRAFT_198461, partial [Capitella teleta]
MSKELYDGFIANSVDCTKDECDIFLDQCGAAYVEDLPTIGRLCPPCKFATNVINCWNTAGLSETCYESLKNNRDHFIKTLVIGGSLLISSDCTAVMEADSVWDVCPDLPSLTTTYWNPVAAEECSVSCGNGTQTVNKICHLFGTDEELSDDRCYGSNQTIQICSNPACPKVSSSQ